MIKRLIYALMVMLVTAPMAIAGQYHINVVNNNGGSITVSKMSGTADAGELIRVFVHPESDLWKLHHISFIREDNDQAIEYDDYYDPNYEAYSFIMPASDVKITAIFVRSLFTVTLSEPAEQGTAIVDKNRGATGDTVFVNTIPSIGFHATGVSVEENNSGNQINVSAIEQNKYSFIIASDDVTVTPLFGETPSHPILVGQPEHGVINVSDFGYEGDTIYVYTQPELGYATDIVRAVADQGSISSVLLEVTQLGENSYYFIMPSCGQVTVNATFQKADYILHFDDMKHGYVSEEITGMYHHFGDTVMLTAYPHEGYALNHLTLTDADEKDLEFSWVVPGESLTFVMPCSDVTVHATFRSAVYEIEIVENELGTITTDVAAAHVGDTVTITVLPDQGCYLTEIGVQAGYEIQGGGIPHAPLRAQGMWYMQGEIAVNRIDDTHYSFVLPEQFNDDITPNYVDDTKIRITTAFKDVGPRVIWCEGNNTLYFDYDAAPTGEPKIGDTFDGQTISDLWIGTMALPASGTPKWNTDETVEAVKRIVFTPGFSLARPTTCFWWFKNFGSLTSIEGMEYLNTSEVTDMTSMFEHCWSLQKVKVNNFDMRKVTSVNKMFFQCSSLTTIYCDSTWNIENSNNMFTYDDRLVGARAYRDVMIDNGTMANPTTGYFTSSRSITLVVNGKGTVVAPPEIAFPGETIAVNATPDAFGTMGSVTVTGNVTGNQVNVTATGDAYTFTMPGEPVTVTVTFNTPELVDAVLWCQDNTTLYFVSQPPESLTEGIWDGHAVTNIWHGGAVTNVGWETPGWSFVRTLATRVVIDSSFVAARPASCYSWFCNFVLITGIDGLENLNTSAVTNMNSMFLGCDKLTTLNVNSFDVSRVTNSTSMFRSCRELTTIYCDSTWNINTSSSMFLGSTKLVGAIPYNAGYVETSMANPYTGYFTSILRYDLNGDGKVDIADVNMLINVILDLEEAVNCKASPDIDRNGEVDIVDMNMLINVILRENNE